MPNAIDFVGPESPKCRQRLSQYCQGNGFDIGSGGFNIVPRTLAIDMTRTNGEPFFFGERYLGMRCPVQLVGDATRLYWFRDSVFDYVFSSHCLEHIDDDFAALKEWVRVIKGDDLLILYLPHKDLYDAFVDNADHKHFYTSEDIKTMLDKICKYEIIIDKIWDTWNEFSFELVVRIKEKL